MEKLMMAFGVGTCMAALVFLIAGINGVMSNEDIDVAKIARLMGAAFVGGVIAGIITL